MTVAQNQISRKSSMCQELGSNESGQQDKTKDKYERNQSWTEKLNWVTKGNNCKSGMKMLVTTSVP